MTNKLLNLIKQIISLIKLIFYLKKIFIQKIENKLKKIFPFKYFYNFIEMRAENSKNENEVFFKYMPKWYKILETNFYLKILRIFMYMWLVFQSADHQDKFKTLCKMYLDFNTLNTLSWANCRFVLTCIVILYLTFFLVLKFILRLIFFKKLVFSSPLNYKKAINWSFSQVGSAIGVAGLFVGVGTLTVDNHLKELGYKPLAQGKISYGWYSTTGLITEKMGSKPNNNLEYFNDEDLKGAGKFLNKIQKHDDSYYEELHDTRNLRLKAAEIKRLSQEVEHKIEK